MDNYRDDSAYRMGQAGSMTPDAQEAKRLRNQLVEYDGYLQEMRKSNMKNVETLDVIQRYTVSYTHLDVYKRQLQQCRRHGAGWGKRRTAGRIQFPPLF